MSRGLVQKRNGAHYSDRLDILLYLITSFHCIKDDPLQQIAIWIQKGIDTKCSGHGNSSWGHPERNLAQSSRFTLLWGTGIDNDLGKQNQDLTLSSKVTQMVKNLPAMQETWVQFLGLEIPWRRDWLPTPVFFLGEFPGQRSLVDSNPWDHKESDTTERLNILKSLTSKVEQMIQKNPQLAAPRLRGRDSSITTSDSFAWSESLAVLPFEMHFTHLSWLPVGRMHIPLPLAQLLVKNLAQSRILSFHVNLNSGVLRQFQSYLRIVEYTVKHFQYVWYYTLNLNFLLLWARLNPLEFPFQTKFHWINQAYCVCLLLL